MNVYLAARYSRKEELLGRAIDLRRNGIGVTSRWLDEPHDSSSDLNDISEELIRQYAIQDIEDIDAADAVVLFSEDPLEATKRGGRHVEFGYALGRKPIYVVGPKENVFHYLHGFRGWNIIHCSFVGDLYWRLNEWADIMRKARATAEWCSVPDATGHSCE